MAHFPLRADSAPANAVARRDVLAAIALSQIATLAPVEAVEASSNVEGLQIAPAAREGDEAFWQALAAYDALDDQWEAAIDAWPNRDIPDAEMDAWGRRVGSAEEAMLRTPVNSLRALYAKILHIRVEPSNYLDDEQKHLVIEVIRWDVERMLLAGGAAA